MKVPWLVCVSTLVLLLSSGTVQAQVTDTIVVHGTHREYVIDLPQSYEPGQSYGLVLCFHGLGGTALSTRAFTMFHHFGDSLRFITVYPQGLLIDSPLAPGTQELGWEFSLTDNRDVAFVDALLDSLIDEYSVDESKVFVTGVSNGGFFSDILGCRLGDRLSAIAPEIGGYPLLTGCSLSKPLPMLRLGTPDDEIVGIENLRAATAFWVEHNGCDAVPLGDGMCESYGRCNSGVEVMHCEFACIKGGLYTMCHTWPGPPNYDFWTTELIVSFFTRQGLGDSAPVRAGGAHGRTPGEIGVRVVGRELVVSTTGASMSPVLVHLHALDGRSRLAVAGRRGEGVARIPLSGVPSGAYACRVVDGGTVYAQPLIVQ